MLAAIRTAQTTAQRRFMSRPGPASVTVANIDALRDPRAARRHLGVAPQDQALYLPATVREHLRLFGSLAGIRGRTLRTAIAVVSNSIPLHQVIDKSDVHYDAGQFNWIGSIGADNDVVFAWRSARYAFATVNWASA